jgi:hypothetical protein
MENSIRFLNPFNFSKETNFSSENQCKFFFYNYLDSMNPNVLALQGNIPKCPICLGYLNEPVKPNNCSHIYCKFCLEMWLQKKENCPLCRTKIDGITKIFFPLKSTQKNNKLSHLFFSIKELKLDNYHKFSEKCLICGKAEPQDNLIMCDCCCYFQSHIECDPPMGLSHGKFYCRFCRKKFIEAIKSSK